MPLNKEPTVPASWEVKPHLLVINCDFEQGPHFTRELSVTLSGVVPALWLEEDGHLRMDVCEGRRGGKL